MGCLIEQGLRGHDLAVLAEAALWYLLIDLGLLHGMQFAAWLEALRVMISVLTEETGVMQEKTAAPLMTTLHAPHCPSPHPKRGPCRSRSFAKDIEERCIGLYVERM
jgi:hypothetical protein